MQLWDIYHFEMPDFLKEAAQTAELQRLKGVGMHCGCEYTNFPLFADLGSYSRYDHSVGVALIIWHFTADVAQTMAGLLHDIATPVFAHVVDFLLGDHIAQESTEQGTLEIIQNSKGLGEVLLKYGLSVDAVADYHQYPVADNDSPKLSADRLEYTLCNAINFGILTRESVKQIYADLTVEKNEYGEPELIFRHTEAAHIFSQAALECSKIYMSDPDRYAMQSLANLLKQAIDLGVITKADLYLQEPIIVDKLKNSCLINQWQQFCGYQKVICQDKAASSDGWLRVFTKKRSIDPFVRDQGRASLLFSDFGMKLKDLKEYSFDYWMRAE